MLLKRVFLTFSLAIVAIAANAQWSVGVLAGYDYNLYDYAKGYAYDLRYDGRAGLDFTVPVQYNFNQWFGLRADIDYVQKGHKMHRSGTHEGTYTNTRDHYLHLPIVASFSFGGEKIRGYLNLGGYMGFWAVSSIEGQARLAMAPDIDDTQYYYFNEKLDFDSKRDNRFDAGLTGSIGLGYYFKHNVEFRAEGLCYYSLIDTGSGSKNNIAPRYNTTFALRVGCIYHFITK